jgi:predicted nucleotidyltransferase
MQDQRQQLVDQVFGYFSKQFQHEFFGQLAALYVVGSYARGTYDINRPDINFLIILEGIDPEDHILLGRVFKEAVKHYRGYAGIRPYFPPFRFIYPEKREAYDIFVSAIVLDSKREDLSLPLGITRWVLDGYVNSRKLLAGQDVFANIKFPSLSRQDLLERSLIDLEFYRLPLEKAPAQYHSDEMDWLLGEAVILGKAVVLMGVEVAMKEAELQAGKYQAFLQDYSLFDKFYKERYDADVAGHVRLILEARKNYLAFKNDKAKILAVYQSAIKLIDAVELKIINTSLGQA